MGEDSEQARAQSPQSAAPRLSLRQRLLWLLWRALICYLGVIVVLLMLENYLIFHPLRASQDWLPPPNERVEDVELSTTDGVMIHAWWCPTEHWEPSLGALLTCHGNAGNLSHRGAGVEHWQRYLGLSVLIFDYPGYGRSQGSPSEAGCYAAADAAYDWLVNKLGVAPQKILIDGGSLGGAVAVDLASRRPHRALVLRSTFTSIADMAQRQFPWLPARWLVRNRFDSLAKIGKCTKPIFIAHGTADSLIPFSQSKRLFDAAGQPKHFFPLAGADHNDMLPPEFHRAVGKFLQEAETESSLK